MHTRLFHSIRFKTMLTLITILLVGIGIISASNASLYKELRGNVMQAYEDMFTNSFEQYNTEINTIDDYFLSYIYNTSEIYDLKRNNNPTTYYISKTLVQTDLDQLRRLYTFTSFLYCYISDEDDFFLSGTSMRYARQQEVFSYIKGDEYRGLARNGQWNLCRIGSDDYLLRTYFNGDVELGVCIKLSDLFPSDSSLTAAEDCIMYFTDTDDNFIIGQNFTNMTENQSELFGETDPEASVEIPVSWAGLNFCACLSESEEMLQNVRTTALRNTLLLCLVFVSIAGFLYYMFWRYLYRPIGNMLSATEQIADGRLDIRLKEDDPTTELATLNKQFNNVILQLTTLKISLYEEKIRYQEALLAQLRLQLNPHLLLNSLNMVYTMNRQNHHETAQQFTLCLIRHFRYVLRKDHNLVPLISEMEFVENYLEIMKLQYEDYFSYDISDMIEENRHKQIMVPPLAIENLAENSIKYGFLQNEPLHLDIDLEEEEIEGHLWTRIVISDDGEGYTQENLENFNGLAENAAGESVSGSNVGIANLITRLKLLYNSKAVIRFSNDMGGATISLLFPSVYPFEEE